MSDATFKWWRQLDPLWKAIVALATALMIGAMFGGWIGLPGQVQNNSVALDSLRAQHREDMSTVTTYMRSADEKWDRVLCHLEEQSKETPRWERCEL